MSEIISAVIGALVAFLALTTAYRRSIDLESEWRKTLFNASGAEKISMKEIQLLRTALRYKKFDETETYSFKWMTNIMIDFCDFIRLNQKKWEKNNELILDDELQEIVRIFIRCVLKYNWEVNEKFIGNFFNNKIIEEQHFIKESFELAKEEFEKIKYKYSEFDFEKYEDHNTENINSSHLKDTNKNIKGLDKFKQFLENIDPIWFPIILTLVTGFKTIYDFFIGQGISETNFISVISIICLWWFIRERKK